MTGLVEINCTRTVHWMFVSIVLGSGCSRLPISDEFLCFHLWLPCSCLALWVLVYRSSIILFCVLQSYRSIFVLATSQCSSLPLNSILCEEVFQNLTLLRHSDLIQTIDILPADVLHSNVGFYRSHSFLHRKFVSNFYVAIVTCAYHCELFCLFLFNGQVGSIFFESFTLVVSLVLSLWCFWMTLIFCLNAFCIVVAFLKGLRVLGIKYFKSAAVIWAD